MYIDQIESFISKDNNVSSYIHFTNSIEEVNIMRESGFRFKKFEYSTDLVRRNLLQLVNERRIFGRYVIIIQLERNVDILSLCSIDAYDRKVLPPEYIVGVVDIK